MPARSSVLVACNAAARPSMGLSPASAGLFFHDFLASDQGSSEPRGVSTKGLRQAMAAAIAAGMVELNTEPMCTRSARRTSGTRWRRKTGEKVRET